MQHARYLGDNVRTRRYGVARLPVLPGKEWANFKKKWEGRRFRAAGIRDADKSTPAAPLGAAFIRRQPSERPNLSRFGNLGRGGFGGLLAQGL